MHVNLHSSFGSLAPLATEWNELACGVPFRRWEWLEAWWRHYGCHEDGRPKRDRELFVLSVWDENEQLMAIAPWYRFYSRSGARVIRFLGDGEVCSDYVSVLCRNGQEESVAEALADWLAVRNQGSVAIDGFTATRQTRLAGNQCRTLAGDYRWHRLEFTGVSATDIVVKQLLAHLQARDHVVHYGRSLNSWRVELPSSWEEFLMILSKPHRNRLRRADKNFFHSGKVQPHHVETPDEVDGFFDVLVNLHQGRWRRRGLPGCFASPAFQAMHREVATKMFVEGRATLSWLEMDGKPLAAEYRLHGDGIMYAYQCGIDSDRLKVQPGELANMAAIRNAIERGQVAYDFLRGDEPYKARWRATPQPLLTLRVIPRHGSARLRHNAWLAGQNVKHWIKNGLKTARHWMPAGAQDESRSQGEPQ
jgi:CelD/BcsL family acetyltransferase involved in cellulose biosynthesis